MIHILPNNHILMIAAEATWAMPRNSHHPHNEPSSSFEERSGQPDNDISFKQRHIQRSLSTDLLRELALEKSSHMPAIHGNLHLFWSILSIDIALGDPT